jgi:hypothetical protein
MRSGLPSFPALPYQISDLEYACGNAGNENFTRIEFSQKPNWNLFNAGATSTMGVQIGASSYLSVTIPGTGTITMSALQNAVVFPTSQQRAVWQQVLLDIPCNDIQNSTLSFVHTAPGSATDVEIGGVSIRACWAETCGGQNIKCPGLKATRACTPGYDCMSCGWGFNKPQWRLCLHQPLLHPIGSARGKWDWAWSQRLYWLHLCVDILLISLAVWKSVWKPMCIIPDAQFLTRSCAVLGTGTKTHKLSISQVISFHAATHSASGKVCVSV